MNESNVIAVDEIMSAEDQERRELIGDKFAEMTVEQRLNAVEGSLAKVGKDMSTYRREKIKKWCKKMRRQLKRAKA